MTQPRRRAPIAAGLVTLLVSACTILFPQPDPSRFFVLTPLSVDSRGGAAPLKRSLGVGPVTLPHYLERPQMVVRVASNEIRPAAFDYWAGSLQEQFEGSLAQNLQALLGSGPVRTFPWYAGTAPDLAVEVDVASFERGADDQARLSARWRVRRGSGEVLRAGESTLARPCAGIDPGATAAALSEVLAELSREIAKAIRAVGS